LSLMMALIERCPKA